MSSYFLCHLENNMQKGKKFRKKEKSWNATFYGKKKKDEGWKKEKK